MIELGVFTHEIEEKSRNKVFIAALLGLFFGHGACAGDAACDAKAAEKKLAGAAKNNFTKKCITDATK